ncbi:hypothetical protein Dfri01_35810 [Dyadobacter frigoris]|nr:hypothetical protein Dfri01_35810 [Dyadobacter frigoris]
MILSCHSKKVEPVIEIGEEILSDNSLVLFDKGFEKELIRLGIDKLGKEDGKIRYMDVKNIETLVIRPQVKEEIQGLKGIEYFVNLKSLTALYTKPDSLDLSSNTKLESLHIETGMEVGGERKSLKYLNISNCKELKILNCRGNHLSKLDLSQNTKLREIFCDDNYDLETLDLSKNTALEILSAPGGERFSKLDLSRNLNLKKLICYSPALKTLDVSMLANLSFLILGASDIDLKLPGLSKLDTIQLYYSNDVLLDFKAIPDVISLSLSGGVKPVDFSSLPKLKSLYLRPGFEKLDLRSNTKLENLVIHDSKLREINLAGNTMLKEFYGDNWIELSSLDLRPCKNLQKFIIGSSPKLSSICVNELPLESDINWGKPDNVKFVVCN